MDISQSGPAHKPDQARRRQRLPNRRENLSLPAHLRALRYEIFVVRCQLENGRSTTPRPLLNARYDAVQHRAADFFARILQCTEAGQ